MPWKMKYVSYGKWESALFKNSCCYSIWMNKQKKTKQNKQIEKCRRKNPKDKNLKNQFNSDKNKLPLD